MATFNAFRVCADIPIPFNNELWVPAGPNTVMKVANPQPKLGIEIPKDIPTYFRILNPPNLDHLLPEVMLSWYEKMVELLPFVSLEARTRFFAENLGLEYQFKLMFPHIFRNGADVPGSHCYQEASPIFPNSNVVVPQGMRSTIPGSSPNGFPFPFVSTTVPQPVPVICSLGSIQKAMQAPPKITRKRNRRPAATSFDMVQEAYLRAASVAGTSFAGPSQILMRPPPPSSVPIWSPYLPQLKRGRME